MSARTIPRKKLISELETLLTILADVGKGEASQYDAHHAVGYAIATATNLLQRLGCKPETLPAVVEREQRFATMFPDLAARLRSIRSSAAAPTTSSGERGVTLPSSGPDGSAPYCENSMVAHVLTANESC